MKRLRMISLILAVVLLGWGGVSSGATTGLVAYYPFNGNANDESANGTNATVSGATLTADRNRNPDSAYSFDGKNGGIRANVGQEFSVTSLTLSAWIKIDGSGDNNPRIVAVGPSGSPFQYYSLILEGTSNSRRLWFYTSKSVSNAYGSFILQNDNTWHFVAVTYSANSVSFYLDGGLSNAVSVSGGLPAFSDGVMSIGYSDNGLDRFDGSLDEIRIYNRALSDAEIKGLYDQDTAARITSSPTPEVLTPGTEFNWLYEITPGTILEDVDLVAAILLPDGSLLFFTENGLSSEPGVLRWGVEVTESFTGTFFSELPFPTNVPQGQYGFYAVLVRAGNLILDDRNWVSNVGGAVVRFSHRSPDQDWFMSNEVAPNGFVKSFSERNGRVRVDETWTYAANQLNVSFVNGNFSGDEPISQPAANGAVSPFRPDHYQFDTTKQDVVGRHGQASATRQYTVWDGAFEILAYDGIVFGFHNDRLAAVLAGPTTTKPQSESPKMVRSDAPFRLDIRPSGALPSQDAAYLFALASALAAAALDQVSGAENAWNNCLSGFQSDAPTETDLQCLKTALSGLVNGASIQLAPASLRGWLRSAWSSLTGHGTTTGKSAANSSDRDSRTGCAGSAIPASVKAGDAVTFRMDMYSRLRDQVGHATIRGFTPSWKTGWQDRMSFIGQGAGLHWEYTKPVAQDERPGPKTVYMQAIAFATSGNNGANLNPATETTLCTALATIFVQSGPPVVTLRAVEKNVRVRTGVTFKACVTGGAPPFSLNWDLAGTIRNISLDAEDIDFNELCDRQERFFAETGDHTIGVGVTDANGAYDYASVQVLVTPPELRLKFIESTAVTDLGRTGVWVVEASGGISPYSYAYSFSDGVSGGGSTISRTFSKPGTHALSVTATDSGTPPQTATISSSIWVRDCDPPDCCPLKPVKCGSVCLPSGTTCCNQSTGEWCTGVDCCPKPCVPPDCCPENPQACGPNCIPGGAKCCNPGTGGWCLGTEDCCLGGCCEPFEKCCHASGVCCKEFDTCCPDGSGCCPSIAPKCCGSGCCPQKDQCCGGGCCPPGSFCCPDESGCCPNGYECIEGGQCRPIGAAALFGVFIENQMPKSESFSLEFMK